MDVNINKLGTGDDSGKSNPYFFHLAYCYEVDSHNMLYKITDNNTTTTPNVDDVNNDKYYLTDVEYSESEKNQFHLTVKYENTEKGQYIYQVN